MHQKTTQWARTRPCIIRKIIRITFLLRIMFNNHNLIIQTHNNNHQQQLLITIIINKFILTIKIQVIAEIVIVRVKFKPNLKPNKQIPNKRQAIAQQMGKFITHTAVMFIKIGHLAKAILIQTSLNK